MNLDALPFSFLIVVLFFTLWLQIFRREEVLKSIRILFWFSVASVLFFLFYTAYLQYQAFNEGLLGLTLNTVSGLKWFFGYVRLHFVNQYLISLIASVLCFWAAAYFNKKRGEIFFERDETFLAALGIFAVGYPAFFFYIIAVLILSIIFSFILVKRGERLPLYYFWMPTAIAVLIAVQFWLSKTAWWGSFRF